MNRARIIRLAIGRLDGFPVAKEKLRRARSKITIRVISS